MLKLVTSDSEHDGTPAEALDTVEDLLTRVATGDQRSFAELYDRIAPRVLGLIKRLLIDHAQSEEVAQEVFLEIWRTATRYPSVVSISISRYSFCDDAFGLRTSRNLPA